jgi:hypothetical protein
MTSNNLTGLTLFGMLLVVGVAASSLLFPVPTTVSAQAADAGDADIYMRTRTNETAATATAGNNNMTGVKFLFIQSAQSGLVLEVNATTSTLELNDVSDKTIFFSDRPDRIVGSANTADFISNWSSGPNNFAADPPNAVLIVDDEIEGEQSQDYAVIELFNPQYDPEANTLRYDITDIAENATTTTSINLPAREFGQSTLVIDDDDLPSGIGRNYSADYPH